MLKIHMTLFLTSLKRICINVSFRFVTAYTRAQLQFVLATRCHNRLVNYGKIVDHRNSVIIPVLETLIIYFLRYTVL